MKALILFPHQLFSLVGKIEMDIPVYLVEEHLYFRKFNFHKQKLVFHRASMKAHEHALRSSD